MITGSPHSVYDNLEWINKLKELVRYLDNIKKKMVGTAKKNTWKTTRQSKKK